jgi:putative endonuclease
VITSKTFGKIRNVLMFYYVYTLFSIKDSKLYIGYCKDLKIRIKKHSKGYVKATKSRRPLKLIYYEAYREEADAKRRELYLKGGSGRKDLKKQLKSTFRKLNYKYK